MMEAPGGMIFAASCVGPEERIEVRPHGRVEVVGRDLLERGEELLVAGIDDEDVETAERVRGSLGEIPRVALVGQVSGQGRRLAARLLDQGDDLVRVRLLNGKVRDRDVGALAGIGDRNRPPDTRVAARNESLATLEFPRALVAFLAVIRRWLSLRGKARCWLGLSGKGRRWIAGLRGSCIFSRSDTCRSFSRTLETARWLRRTRRSVPNAVGGDLFGKHVDDVAVSPQQRRSPWR